MIYINPFNDLRKLFGFMTHINNTILIAPTNYLSILFPACDSGVEHLLNYIKSVLFFLSFIPIF